MNDVAMNQLTDDERRFVTDALARVDAEASPFRLQILGWVLTFFGTMLLVLTPAVGRYVEISRETAVVLAFIGAALLFAGAGAVVFTSLFLTGGPAKKAAMHIELLGSGELSRLDTIDSATRLLFHARVPGRGQGTTFDVRAAADRIGDAMETVRAVESELVARGRIVPVFSASA